MTKDQENEKALRRHEIIAPLLVPGLEEAEKRRIRRKILQRESISERTLRRYLAAYRETRYEGLKPKTRSDTGKLRVMSQEILARAAELKQELPGRSLRRIIRILEGEGVAEKGEISRSTLSRHLVNMGFGSAELKMTKVSALAVRRFVKRDRNTPFGRRTLNTGRTYRSQTAARSGHT